MSEPSASIDLGPITQDDWPSLRDIFAEGIATGHARFEESPPSWVEFDADRLPSHRILARDRTGLVLGWVALSTVSNRPIFSGVAELSVYVAASARGRGVGRQLLDALIASADAGGIWTLQAGIFPENTASLALHAAAGFRTIGIRERMALMSHGPMAGQWRDIVLVERRSPVVG